MLIVQGHSNSSIYKIIYTSCTWGYIFTEINRTIYIQRWTTSTVYFMYKSRAFKPVNKLEKPGTEKAKNHNNKK